jgi:hypothetical protein
MGELQAEDGDAETLDMGTLLLNMALDAPPPVTVADAMPPVGCPLDAIYAAIVVAANGADAERNVEAQKLYEDRQMEYRDAIEDSR